MNLKKLYQLQAKFDETIEYNEPDRLKLLFFSFKVELYELANETRCFKFWSTKFKEHRDSVLEEFVDGLHFLLSIGNHMGYSRLYPDVEPFIPHSFSHEEWSLVEQIESVEESINALKKTKVDYLYEQTLQLYLGIGEMLEFTPKQINYAYNLKNDINHKRQANAY